MPRAVRSEPAAAAATAARVPGAAAFEKAMALLDRIAGATTPPAFSALLAEGDLPRSTLHRLLLVLESHGLVRRDDPDRGYRLGYRLLELAHVAWSELDVRVAAEPELAQLRDETGETVQLAVLDGDAAVIVDRASGRQAIRHDAAVGARSPWWESAAGKALVAFSEPRQAALRLAAAPAGTLVAELGLTRGRSYAVDTATDDEGVSGLGAPILDIRGLAVAAIGLTGPAFRLDDRRLHALAPLLIAAARRISHNAGGSSLSIVAGPAPGASSAGVRCVLPASALLGEAPHWVARDRLLYWVDMLAPAIHRWRPEPAGRRSAPTGALPPIAAGELVSVAIPRRQGGLLVARPSGLAFVDPGTGRNMPFVHPERERPGNRYNDGKCDARGRLWIGSMDPTGQQGRGSLLRVEPDGRWERVDTGISVANGIGFSPDGRTLYFADSARRLVWAYDCDPATGAASRRRVFVEFADANVRPGGLAVDAAGGVWIALWDGWRVERYAPDGRHRRTVRLPVPRPTSVCFGGDGLTTLYITTARVRLDPGSLERAPLSGGLFAIDTRTAGLPVAPFGG